MKVKIKLVDSSLPVPEYKTPGSVGFDLYVRQKEEVQPGEIKALDSNAIIAVPKGHFLLVTGRSSAIHKYGLLVVSGIIDPDYSGDDDEFHIQVVNLTKKKVIIEKGTRIAQGILIKISKAKFSVVKKMNQKSRGGFGTTGHK